MRRSRYTVTFSTGEKTVVLAYAGQNEDIRKHYARYGKVVVGITLGDFRKATPATSGGWSIHRRNFDEARGFFGLKLPVTVKQTGHQGGRYGAYSLRLGRDGKPYHHITVKSWLDVTEAGRTLWHELTHAMQAERAIAAAGAVRPVDCMAAWKACPERMGAYRRKPIEVEAREHESLNDDTPLAR